MTALANAISNSKKLLHLVKRVILAALSTSTLPAQRPLAIPPMQSSMKPATFISIRTHKRRTHEGGYTQKGPHSGEEEGGGFKNNAKEMEYILNSVYTYNTP